VTAHFLIRQLIHDLYSGISRNKVKYLLCLLAFAMLSLLFYTQSNSLIAAHYEGLDEGSAHRSVLDYLIFMSRGIEEYVPSLSKPFTIPVFWAILQVLIALLVSVYPTEDLQTYAVGVLTRTGSRTLWWVSKVGWVIFTVCSFYLLGLAVVFVFALAVGDMSVFPVSDISAYATQIDARGPALTEVLMSLLVPPLVSIALSLAQMTLSFIVKPTLSFIAVMAYYIASAYLSVPVLIGGYSMVIRNGMVMEGGMSSAVMIIISCAVALLAAGSGSLYFKRMDIL
jgi:hypothetical protein